MSTASQDLTGRARLRDAAIESFAAQGFDESLRAIAARAGVSAGLVRHHFGSKEVLRAECDQVVLERYRALKSDSFHRSPNDLFSHLPNSHEGGILLLYILRAVQAGADAGRTFVEHFIVETTQLMTDAVAGGLIKPSRNESARARYLVLQSLGAIAIHFSLHPPPDPTDYASVMDDYYRDIALPALELYTDGLLVSSDYLNMYMASTEVNDPPA